MEIDKIFDEISNQIGKRVIFGKWVLHVPDKSSNTTLTFKSSYEIVNVIRENQRIRVQIAIQLVDSWEVFQQEAQRLFTDIIKEQLTDRFLGTEDILNIVLTDPEGMSQ